MNTETYWREIFRYLGYKNGARPEGGTLRMIAVSYTHLSVTLIFVVMFAKAVGSTLPMAAEKIGIDLSLIHI